MIENKISYDGEIRTNHDAQSIDYGIDHGGVDRINHKIDIYDGGDSDYQS